MDRPYIICHMETSLNAKIYGPFMNGPHRESLARNYDETHLSFNSEAWLCGRVTMELFAGKKAPAFDPNAPIYPREDHIADTDAKDFVVVADPSGKLGWTTNTVQYNLRPAAHIIELLTDRASDQYVSYLRQQRISYIFAGADQLDLPLAVMKLKSLFGIKTLVVSGGAIINGSFIHAGLIDEVSLIVAPVVDDAIGIPTFFERTENLPSKPPVAFSLKSMEKLPDDNLWLRYTTKR